MEKDQKMEKMKGILHKIEDDNRWIVIYNTTKEIQLHPDDVNDILEQAKVFDNIESRIVADPRIEFEIVEHKKMGGVATYAKIIKNYLNDL